MYKSCLKVFIVSKLKILLKINEVLFSILGLVDGIIKQIGKWSETSLLKIAVLKFLSKKELVRILSIAVAVVLVTLVVSFMVSCHFCKSNSKNHALFYLIHDQVD